MDKAPENMLVGAINPYALTEAITGRSFDWTNQQSIHILEETLEKNYSELFDIKYNSPLFTGLKLEGTNTIKAMTKDELKIRTASQKESMDFSHLAHLKDLSEVGVKKLDSVSIKEGRLVRGRLNLVLDIPKLDNTISNKVTTMQIKDIALAYLGSSYTEWNPANRSWRDLGNFFNDVVEFNDPIQGAVGNCYFIAAIAALAWADPYNIEHKVRATGVGETQRTNAIQFYSKGGGKDAPSKLIEVTDSTIVNNANNRAVYCRSNDGGEIWPSVYEKAFAKWITKNNSDKPDITQTAFGDPVKAIAQLNDKSPQYFNTSSRSGAALYGIVRGNSAGGKTIHPMVAWTYGSGIYSGSNIVGNHAYTVLGWAYRNGKKYIILRNPWGVTEPAGVNSYQGVISFIDKSFWRPINFIGNDGVFALEADSFKYYFAGLGVAK